ncbi:MAG: hypothetical protein ACEQSU_08340 [Microgenomates group bacterium]
MVQRWEADWAYVTGTFFVACAVILGFFVYSVIKSARQKPRKPADQGTGGENSAVGYAGCDDTSAVCDSSGGDGGGAGGD